MTLLTLIISSLIGAIANSLLMRSGKLFWRGECVSLRLCSKKSLHSFLLDKCEFYTSLRHKHSHTRHWGLWVLHITTILQKQTIAHACIISPRVNHPCVCKVRVWMQSQRVESWNEQNGCFQLVCRSDFLLIRRKTQKIYRDTLYTYIKKKWN